VLGGDSSQGWKRAGGGGENWVRSPQRGGGGGQVRDRFLKDAIRGALVALREKEGRRESRGLERNDYRGAA